MIIDGIGAAYVPQSTARAKPQAAERKTEEKAGEETPSDDAAQAVESVKQAKADMHCQRKEFAAEKVRRLKQELLNLKLTGGDPKAIARQAARIARAAAGAVQSYRGSARMIATTEGADTTALAMESRTVTADARLVHQRLKSVLDAQRRRKDRHDGEDAIARQAAAQLAPETASQSLSLDV